MCTHAVRIVNGRRHAEKDDTDEKRTTQTTQCAVTRVHVCVVFECPYRWIFLIKGLHACAKLYVSRNIEPHRSDRTWHICVIVNDFSCIITRRKRPTRSSSATNISISKTMITIVSMYRDKSHVGEECTGSVSFRLTERESCAVGLFVQELVFGA